MRFNEGEFSRSPREIGPEEKEKPLYKDLSSAAEGLVDQVWGKLPSHNLLRNIEGF